MALVVRTYCGPDRLRHWSPYANTIALDLPGHGKSRGDAKASIEEIAGEVESFIRSLNITQPVVCGLSIGGAIALQLLINNGDAYQGGILINTGARLKVMPAIFETLKQGLCCRHRIYRKGCGIGKNRPPKDQTDDCRNEGMPSGIHDKRFYGMRRL